MLSKKRNYNIGQIPSGQTMICLSVKVHEMRLSSEYYLSDKLLIVRKKSVVKDCQTWLY